MGASGLVWTLTIVLIAGLMLVDYVLHVRKTHVPTLRQAVIQSATFVGIAILFGIAVVVFGGSELAVEYFACYLTDEALSVDNLFVFLVIISSFGVPRLAQQKVLLFGIAFALVTRTGFIFVGAALIENFNSAFYLFGLVLLVMAGNLARPHRARKPRRRNAQEVRHYPASRPLLADLTGLQRRPVVHGLEQQANDDPVVAGHDRRGWH